jgi:hypothetical protein
MKRKAVVVFLLSLFLLISAVQSESRRERNARLFREKQQSQQNTQEQDSSEKVIPEDQKQDTPHTDENVSQS